MVCPTADQRVDRQFSAASGPRPKGRLAGSLPVQQLRGAVDSGRLPLPAVRDPKTPRVVGPGSDLERSPRSRVGAGIGTRCLKPCAGAGQAGASQPCDGPPRLQNSRVDGRKPTGLPKRRGKLLEPSPPSVREPLARASASVSARQTLAAPTNARASAKRRAIVGVVSHSAPAFLFSLCAALLSCCARVLPVLLSSSTGSLLGGWAGPWLGGRAGQFWV